MLEDEIERSHEDLKQLPINICSCEEKLVQCETQKENVKVIITKDDPFLYEKLSYTED